MRERLIRTMADVTLRNTTPDDLDFVLRVENDPEHRPYIAQWSREVHLEALSDPGTRHWMIVGGPGAAPVGYVILRGFGGESVELMRIAVTDKGRGYGRSAVRHIKDRVFAESGARSIWLDLFHYNEPAKALYESEGFRVTGTRERVDAGLDPGEPLIVMELTRPHGP